MFEALMVLAPHEQVNREIRPYNRHALLHMVSTYTCISTQDIVSFPCFIFIINESQYILLQLAFLIRHYVFEIHACVSCIFHGCIVLPT